MKILALDAGLGPFSAALDADGTLLTDRSAGNDALEAGLGRIATLLARADLRLGDLDRIAVGTGPGSFTGIRIALSFAKALAYGSGVPLVPVSSYDILTPPDARGAVLTIVSGRPGIVCARLIDGAAVTVACGPSAAVFARLLPNWPTDRPLTVAANTEDEFPEIGEASPHAARYRSPATNPAAIAAILARRREPVPSPHSVAPDYGEMPAVTVPKAGTTIAP